MLTEITCTFKLESLKSVSEAAITSRLHELLLDQDLETDNFFGDCLTDYALLMPDIEVETESV
jgi:hypothetical protein